MPCHAQEIKQILELAIDTPLDLKKKYITAILRGVWLEGKVEGVKEAAKEMGE